MLAKEIANIKIVYCRSSVNEMADRIAKEALRYFNHKVVSNE